MPQVAKKEADYSLPCFIGIDPGVSGGLALIGRGQNGRVILCPMPETEKDIFDWLDYRCCPLDFAVIEKVGGFLRGGEGTARGSHMFTFGYNVGALVMALTAMGVPFEQVPPRTWQKAVGMTPRKPHDKVIMVEAKKGKNKGKLVPRKAGGETDSEWKNRLKRRAQQLYPNVEVTLKTADALLIAHYCRMKQEGKIKV